MRGPSFFLCLSAAVLSVASSATLPAQLSPSQTFAAPGLGILAASSSAGDVAPGQIHPPPSPPDNELLGDVLTARKQYRAALEAYSKTDHLSAAAWNRRGIDYQMLLDLKDAARCYKEAVKLAPNDMRALNNLATVQEAMNDFSGAEHNYRKALRIEPHSAQVLKNIGTDLIMLRQYNKAAQAYAQALAIDPHIFDAPAGPTIVAATPVQQLGAQNYFQARSCARASLGDCSLMHLRKAFNEGAATIEQVTREADFNPLREKADFQSLLAEQK